MELDPSIEGAHETRDLAVLIPEGMTRIYEFIKSNGSSHFHKIVEAVGMRADTVDQHLRTLKEADEL